MSAFALNTVVAGYLRAALWTGSREDETPYDDAGFEVDNIDPVSQEQAREDCDKFCREHETDLLASGMSESSIGHNLWLTRCGHGTGFWDRDLGAVGDRLTEGCERIGDATLLDDGDPDPASGILTIY